MIAYWADSVQHTQRRTMAYTARSTSTSTSRASNCQNRTVFGRKARAGPTSPPPSPIRGRVLGHSRWPHLADCVQRVDETCSTGWRERDEDSFDESGLFAQRGQVVCGRRQGGPEGQLRDVTGSWQSITETGLREPGARGCVQRGLGLRSRPQHGRVQYGQHAQIATLQRIEPVCVQTKVVAVSVVAGDRSLHQFQVEMRRRGGGGELPPRPSMLRSGTTLNRQGQ